MNIKEIMQKLSFSFEYERLKEAILQQDKEKIADAALMMDRRETRELNHIFRKVAHGNIPPNLAPEAVAKFIKESPIMKDVQKAIRVRRREFMPIWARVFELVEAIEKESRTQPPVAP